MYTLFYGISSATARAYDDLGEAMAAAGYPDPGGWHFAGGEPGRIFTDWLNEVDPARDYHGLEYLNLRWDIQAPGIARELICLLSPQQCAERLVPADGQAVTEAVTAALPIPAARARAAAVKLAAHHAVAGQLAWTTITAVLLTTSCGELSPAAAAALASQAASRLRRAGIAVCDDAGKTPSGLRAGAGKPLERQ